jgi:hypothetical protein
MARSAIHFGRATSWSPSTRGGGESRWVLRVGMVSMSGAPCTTGEARVVQTRVNQRRVEGELLRCVHPPSCSLRRVAWQPPHSRTTRYARSSRGFCHPRPHTRAPHTRWPVLRYRHLDHTLVACISPLPALLVDTRQTLAHPDARTREREREWTWWTLTPGGRDGTRLQTNPISECREVKGHVQVDKQRERSRPSR